MSGLQIESADFKHTDQILYLFRQWSTDHPELANRQLFEWQRSRRYLVTLSEKVVGHLAQFPQSLCIKGKTETIGWAATLVLDESNPVCQAVAGTMLLDKLINDKDLMFGAIGLVPEIEPTYIRRGINIDRESVCMFGRFFRTKPVLKYYNKSPLLGPAIHLANLFYLPRKGSPGIVKEIHEFESEWDSIWQKLLSSQYEAFCLRNAEYLNYQLQQPHKKYTILLHFENDGSPSGYVVCRVAKHPLKQLKLYKVCDLVGTISAKFSLLDEVMKRARSMSVDGLVALGSQQDAGLYQKAGLWVRKPLPVVLSPEKACALHLTFFDSDLDHLW